MAVSRAGVSVATIKEKPGCFFLPLFTAFAGWHLEFFTSGLCWGWQGQNLDEGEGLLGGEPPEGMSNVGTETSAPSNCADAVASGALAAGAFGDGPPSPSHPRVYHPGSPNFSQHQAGISWEELQLGQSLFPILPPIPSWVSISSPSLGASPGWDGDRCIPGSPVSGTGLGPESKSSKCLLNELMHFSNYIKVLVFIIFRPY